MTHNSSNAARATKPRKHVRACKGAHERLPVHKPPHIMTVADSKNHVPSIDSPAAEDDSHIKQISNDPMVFGAENVLEAKLFNLQNLLTLMAVVLLIATRFVSALSSYTYILYAAAYMLGAGAYTCKLFILTDGFKRHDHAKELFMPYAFGGLYLVLGISYFFV